jgi:hypothetical protein
MAIKLADKYPEERQAICMRLLAVMGMGAEGGRFLATEFEADVEKQTAILEMKDEIKKYFRVSCLAAFKKGGYECKKPALSLLRAILKEGGWTVVGKSVVVGMMEEKTECSMMYSIFRKL